MKSLFASYQLPWPPQFLSRKTLVSFLEPGDSAQGAPESGARGMAKGEAGETFSPSRLDV